MPRPPIPQDRIDRVEEIWADDPDQSGRKVYEIYNQRHREAITKRWTEGQVSRLKKRRAELDNPSLEKKKWMPWVSGDTPEDTSFIFELQRYCVLNLGRGIYEHEAAWAKRLRVALSGAPMRTTWLIVRFYALREEIAFSIGREQPATDDLDGFVAFKAWLPENESDYFESVGSGLITFPHFFRAINFANAVIANWPESFRDHLPPEARELPVKLGLINLAELGPLGPLGPEIFG